MFTGIIEEVGSIRKVADKTDIHQYCIHASSKFITGVQIGDSIAVNGVCLTAYDINDQFFHVDVSEETQACTNFGRPIPENRVNLERSATPSTRLGGHIVSGHVDTIGKLLERENKDNESVLWFEIPTELLKYIAVKGSICINGVSLTINQIQKNNCCLTIIPHTLKHTNLRYLQPQDIVNIEVDLIARYLERLMQLKS